MILFAQLSEDKLKERFTVSVLSMANKIKQNTMNEEGIKWKKNWLLCRDWSMTSYNKLRKIQYEK